MRAHLVVLIGLFLFALVFFTLFVDPSHQLISSISLSSSSSSSSSLPSFLSSFTFSSPPPSSSPLPPLSPSKSSVDDHERETICQKFKCSQSMMDQENESSTLQDEVKMSNNVKEILPGISHRKKPSFYYKDLASFAEYASKPRLRCPQRRFMGGHMRDTGVRDGDRAVCFAPAYNITPGDCLVYSFGIGGEWSFDDAMAGYGCEVYSFDPTTGLISHNRSDKIHFYGIGLAGENQNVSLSNGNNVTMKTLKSIMDMLGHTNKTIDYLKMDIESHEMSVIEQLSDDPQLLLQIKQIGMEIHPGLHNQQIFYNLFVLLEYFGFTTFDARRSPTQGLWYTTKSLPGFILSKTYEMAWAQVENIFW